MLEEERAARLRMEVRFHEEADSRRRLIDGMEKLAGYYMVMSRELLQLRMFFDISAPTTATSISQAPPPPTGSTLLDDPPPPPPVTEPTADPSDPKTRLPLPPAPVLPTAEQTPVAESQPTDPQQIAAGETPSLPDDSADWAAFL